MTELIGASNSVKPITPQRLARARQLPPEARAGAAAAVVAEGRAIKPTKQMVAGFYGVSVGNIDRELGSHRRRPYMAPKTLAALNDLYQEIFFLSEIKYRDAQYRHEQLTLFVHYFAKWLTTHSEIQDLCGIDSAAALHGTAVNALWALVDAIVSNIE